MKHSIPYILIVVLAVSLFFSLTNKRVEIVEKHTTDTTTVVRIDTLRLIRDTFIYETIVDTQYIEKTSKNGLELVFTQKYYHNDQYDIWVSGYKPCLDSVYVYQRTINNSISHRFIKNIYPKTTDFYLNAGNLIINSKFAPNIGASVKFRNNLVIGANVGIYDKSVYYGINFGYKLNNR